MASRARVLVAGDVEGRFDAVFKRVAALNASNGPFDMVLCVGRFFPPDGAAAAAVPEAPIPTYVFEDAGAGGPLAADQELAKQVHFLGRAGIRTLRGRISSMPLTVAVLADSPEPADVERMCSDANAPGFLGADLLLSSDWPRGQEVDLPESSFTSMAELGVHLSAVGSDAVAATAAATKPRYHFAGTHGVFFQRPPYRNHPQPPAQRRSHVTRFIGLGRAAATKDKARKWLHAIEIEPIPYMDRASLIAEPAGCTDSPFLERAADGLESIKRARTDAPMGAGMVSLIEREEGVRGGAAGSWVPTLAAAAANGSTSGSSFFFGDTHSTGASGGRKRGRQARDQVSGARKLTSRGRGGPGRIFTSSPVGRAQDAEVSSDNTTLYVGNLPPGTEAAALRAAVSAYPGMDDAIKEVRVPPGKQFGFVDFLTHDAAKAALSALQGVRLGREELQLSWGKAATPASTRSAAAPRQVYPQDARTNCWFCLAAPECQTHLVVSVANEVYLALPKGGLVAEHVLLVPIAHASRLPDLGAAAIAEFDSYKRALARMYAKQDAALVVFERCADTKGCYHMHQQAIPVPTRGAASLASTICSEGAQQGLQFIEVPSQQPPQDAVGDGHYFLFEVWLGADVEPVRLVHRAATTGPRIPLHFGRKLLADVLQIPQRAHWKACEQSQDMETAACEVLRAKWREFDFATAQ